MTMINGRPEPEAAGKKMIRYLEEKGYRTERIAVECDGKILPKDQYGLEGDRRG